MRLETLDWFSWSQKKCITTTVGEKKWIVNKRPSSTFSQNIDYDCGDKNKDKPVNKPDK